MKRRLLVAMTTALVVALVAPAWAALRDVDIGNYYFEDVATGERKVITVNEGDQIRFTVRQETYPPHDVVIDGYGPDYQSGQLLLLETFTTPPLNKPGTFALYCRAHRRRGHEAKLVVKENSPPAPAASSTPTKKSSAKPQGSPAPSASATAIGTTPASPGAVPSSIATATLAPAGHSVAADRRVASPDANSLAGILGRDIGGGEPWTTAVRTWLLAAIPIAGLAGIAIRRALQR